MNIDQITAEAAAEIECLVFDGERNVNDWERIIKSAIEKATEAAEKLCHIYFEIAVSAFGEDLVRAKRDAMIDEYCKDEPAP